MANIHSCPRTVSTMNAFLTLAGASARRFLAVTTIVFAVTCMAQDQTQTQLPSPPDSQADVQSPATDKPATETIPAGTRITLVLTHPILSRSIRRGDDIYAQITSPVNSGRSMLVPPGTFVQGTVDKLELRGGRAQLHLQSMSITFPSGYVAPVTGPVTLESDEGYALKDPGKGRFIAGFALPVAGAGLGALIGHFAANAHSNTITNTLPPDCGVPTPGCTNGTSQSLTIPGSTLRSTAIGTSIGAAIGMVASVALLFNSHHFFLDVGSPVDMVLPEPISLEQSQIDSAVRESEQHPVAVQPIEERPAPPPPTSDSDHGTCFTPGTPGTPPTVISGMPGPDGVPGPPTIIPGTPPTPGTPYPCP